jgi:chromosome segregation ATPase
MQNCKHAIAELQKAIDKDGTEVLGTLRKLGEHLSYQDVGALSDPAMKELHGRVQELRRHLPDSRQQVKRILQTVSGNEALEKEIRVRKLQINELSGRNQDICESIGRAAYRAYKDHPVAGEAPEAWFESLKKLEQELSELEDEQKTLQEHGREGKFFKKFRETGRSMYVKGLLSLRRKAGSRVYYEVGKQISGSPGLKEELGDRRLEQALAPFEANDRQIKTLHQELDELHGDQEKKWSELKNMGAHRSHQKRVREIESEIRRIESKLQDSFEGLGTLGRNGKVDLPQNAETARLIHRMEEIERGTRSKEKRIRRLNAALQVDALHDQLGGLAARISRLEGEIETRRRDIETLHAQITVGEKEIQRMQRIRGSKQSLLDGEGA